MKFVVRLFIKEIRNLREFNEREEGKEDFKNPDAMLAFCKSNNISVRGHNVLWDDPKYVGHMKWLNGTSDEHQKAAAMKRVKSVVTRYKGQFIHWDVINENIHYDHFSRLTSNGVEVFKLVHELDPSPILFINEFNVIEAIVMNSKVAPYKLLDKITQIRSGGYDGPMGIGLQSHFDDLAPNYAYIRASIDMFATTGFPIWITEFDVDVKDPTPDMVINYFIILYSTYIHIQKQNVSTSLGRE